MAKNTMLPMKPGGGLLGKVIAALVGLALLAIIVRHPGDAASWARTLAGMIGAAVDGVSSFLRDALG
jgi:hypothetical protein